MSSHTIFTDSSAHNRPINISIHSLNIIHFPIFLIMIATKDILNIFCGKLLAIDIVLIQLFYLFAQN